MKKFSSRVKAAAVSAALLASSAVYFPSAVTVSDTVNAAGAEINYAKALQYSMYFYDANMCFLV